MNRHCWLAVTLLCGILNAPVHSADWPQWRGPLYRNGISSEKSLLPQWPAEGPKLLWQLKDISDGYSTPAVVGDHLFVISNKGRDDEFVQCLAVADGKQVWSTKLGGVGPNRGQSYTGSRSTPTVDGEQMFALASDGDLACLESATGKIIWQKNLRSDFGGRPGNWAYAESPLVDGDLVLCTPGGSEATIVALNKKDGSVAWKCAVPGGDRAAYASVITVDSGGLKQYVQFLGSGLVGVEAKTGKFLWRYDHTAQGSSANIPTPVAAGEFVYSAAGRSGGGLVELKVSDGGVEAKEVYFATKLPTAIGGAVKVDGFLYGSNSQGLICADFATGEVKWQDKCVGAGSVCVADGRLYVHGERGDVALVEVTPEAYHELGRFTPTDQPDRGRAKAWAYPVVANGRLFIRDLGTLWCYDVKAAADK